MLLKKSFVRKLRNLIVIFFSSFLIILGGYFYISFTREINALHLSIELIKNLITEESAVALTSNITHISFIFTTQLILFTSAIIMLLASLWHLFQLYLVQMHNALVDPLTQIYNRRAVMYALEKEIKRSQRYKHPTTIAMLDIDFFKKYNDSNGHVAGDKLLKRFAKILRKEIREYDTLGRYGGEEFIIVFPETKLNEIKKIAERIRKIVDKTIFSGQENMPTKNVTTSIGLAEYNGKGKMTNDQLIQLADEKLYRAKESGRNRVIWDHEE